MNPRYVAPHKYRVLFLDHQFDVTRQTPIDACDDDMAMDLASDLADGQWIEVWDGLRQVVPATRMGPAHY